jgi:hypothetical protein
MPKIKKPITVRMDPELLAQVRLSAARDNRSVTNFIETALRRQLEPEAPAHPGRDARIRPDGRGGH